MYFAWSSDFLQCNFTCGEIFKIILVTLLLSTFKVVTTFYSAFLELKCTYNRHVPICFMNLLNTVFL